MSDSAQVLDCKMRWLVCGESSLQPRIIPFHYYCSYIFICRTVVTVIHCTLCVWSICPKRKIEWNMWRVTSSKNHSGLASQASLSSERAHRDKHLEFKLENFVVCLLHVYASPNCSCYTQGVTSRATTSNRRRLGVTQSAIRPMHGLGMV